MTQFQGDLPIYESAEDALKAAVQALGGSKKVGQMLWPDKTVDAAARHLLDCLNGSRHEKLELAQVMLILRMAKEIGCYSPFAWIAGDIGFAVTPITKADEVDRLTTVVEQSTKTLAAALAQLERIKDGGASVTHLRSA